MMTPAPYIKRPATRLQIMVCTVLLLAAANIANAGPVRFLHLGRVGRGMTLTDTAVTFTATPGSKNALFKSGQPITYNIDIVNPLKDPQAGKVTYRVISSKGKFIAEDSLKVNIGGSSSKHFQLNMPARTIGFYKINLMINVSDYDDTIRRAFGVDAQNIQSPYGKPADFDQFWKDTKKELAGVKPNFKMTEVTDSAGKDNRRLYLVEMQSLDNITVRAWLTIPISKEKGRKFSVLLGLPGYQVDLKPGFGVDPDIAVMYLNVRGQGNSRDVIHTNRKDFIYYNVEDKNKYVMRGVIMDCIRCVDFICSRPELDKTKIMITGGSMGGYLAIATAGLDNRVALFSAMNPIMSDIRNLPPKEWPLSDITQYAKTKPGTSVEAVLSNMDYYDAKNFATTISRPLLMGIGLLDYLAPPANEFALYNNIPNNKKIMVFDNLGHEVSMDYVNYQGHWARDTFALF